MTVRSLLAGALFGVLVAALLLEIGVRIWLYPDGPDRRFDTASLAESPRWVPHPFVPYAGPPNALLEPKDDDGSSERIVTNSYGFRAHEFPAEKKPDDFWIFAFGESTTYGFKVADNSATWPERLEARLREHYPRRDVRVFNLGVDMASSAFSVVNLALVAVHRQPDLVIIYHGCNDVMVLDRVGYRWDHSHFYRDIEPVAQRSLQARLPQWLRRSQALIVLTWALDERDGVNDLYRMATLLPAPGEGTLLDITAILRNYHSLHALATSTGGTILFSTFQFRETTQPRLQLFNEALRAEFTAHGWWFVDQEELIPDRDPSLQVDLCHFTQKGRDLLAENFFAAIVERGVIDPEP